MTSFISALSLFVLALVSGCFTLPITENPLSDTSSPFYNDITTDKPLGERMVSDDITFSSTSVGIQRSSDESVGFETSSVFEDATREPRTFVDVATEVSATFVPTTERSFHQQREVKESSEVTVEPTTERVEFVPRDFGKDSENENEVATESSPSKREFDNSEFTTSNSVTGPRSSQQLFTTIEPKSSSTEMQLDFTTNVTPSFTSTSSAVAPELYTREPSTTRKYTGLLVDKEDQEEDKEHNDEEHEESHEKHEKAHGKHKKPHVKHESESEEHKHEEEVKKDKKHKKLQSKHDKDELEVEESKQEEDKEEKKVSGKHQKEETDEEEPKQKGNKKVKKVSGKHQKEEIENEEPKQEEDKEEKKVSGKHQKEETEEEEPKQKGDKEVKKAFRKHRKEETENEEPKQEEDKEEKEVSGKHQKEETDDEKPKQKENKKEKKVFGKHRKEEIEVEEPKQEGDKVEEGRQPEKHDEDHSEKDVEAAEPKYKTKKRPTTFRKAKIESDDGIEYPKALYDQDAWKKIPQIPSDFAILDETSDVVTTISELNPLNTEESKLNQGEEPSRAE